MKPGLDHKNFSLMHSARQDSMTLYECLSDAYNLLLIIWRYDNCVWKTLSLFSHFNLSKIYITLLLVLYVTVSYKLLVLIHNLTTFCHSYLFIVCRCSLFGIYRFLFLFLYIYCVHNCYDSDNL